MTASKDKLEAVIDRFEMDGDLVAVAPLGHGLIHTSYKVERSHDGGTRRYVVQRINQHVFPEPQLLMENVQRVTAHLRDSFAADGREDLDRACLSLVPTRNGRAYVRDPSGECWRAYRYIEGSCSHRRPENAAQVYEAARAFGAFQRRMQSLPPPSLHEVIPDFHATTRRCEQLEHALEGDPHDRVAAVRPEVEFARKRLWSARVLPELQARGKIPVRVVHNDTKLENVLFDVETDDALCVVDLDTVMPGLALHDFGDLVRSCVNPAAEDDMDLSAVGVEMPLFECAVHGFIAGTGGTLTAVEIAHLAFSPRLIAYELGIRFLTDHLNGDVYFKAQRAGQNLDRCRVQFRLVERLEEEAAAMNDLVRCIAG